VGHHVKQVLKGIHGQAKKHGGEGVSLADASGMVEGGTPLSIEQLRRRWPCGTGRKSSRANALQTPEPEGLPEDSSN
jgi:hypothetical protein